MFLCWEKVDLNLHFTIDGSPASYQHVYKVAPIYLVTRYAFPIKCTKVIYADNPDEIVKIQAEYDPSKISKPKVIGHLNLFKSYKSI
jgi:hypothetical protein